MEEEQQECREEYVEVGEVLAPIAEEEQEQIEE